MTVSPMQKLGIVMAVVLVGLGVAVAGDEVKCGSGCAVPGVAGDAPAAMLADSITATVTITAIDQDTRAITLKNAEGEEKTIIAGPAVQKFDQLAVGDLVKISYTEAVAVALGKDAAVEPGAEADATLVRTPEGAAPGGVAIGTAQITAKVTALDVEKRLATLQLPDDSTREIKVSDQVDLAKVTVGDTVTLAVVEALAISVEKPE